jgi:hypothetical protein
MSSWCVETAKTRPVHGFLRSRGGICRMSVRAVVGVWVALLGVLGAAVPAAATPPQPVDLRVAGDPDAWHAENRFRVVWTGPPGGGPGMVATHYRVRDPLGTPVGEAELGWVTNEIGSLSVPHVPAVYSAEVWLENDTGEEGPAATTQLRFDDARPAAIEPDPVPSWIGRTAFPLPVRLGHPAGPLPISGIRGYAVAIDSKPGGVPCAAADRCNDAETTLRGGVGEDELTIPALPEGISYLHAVAVSGSGMKSAGGGQAALHVDTTDPVTQLSGAPGGWTNGTAWLTASATDSGAGMEPVGDSPPPFTAIRIDGGAPQIALGGSAGAGVIEEGVHRIAYYARDAAGNVDDGAESNGIANRAPRTALVRIDRTPPGVAFSNSQDPLDPDLVRVRIVDALSGPSSSRGWIGVRRAGSGDRFEPLPGAPAGDGELGVRWSSDAFPVGEYEFRAIGYDAAGNATATTRRANGEPMVLSNPLKATTALSAAFQHQALRRTAPYGRGVLIAGRLTTGVSSPLAGMPVRIVERFADGARPAERVSTLRTGPGGTFAIRTAPGPSRTIVAAFEGASTLARSEGRTLDLAVRSRVRMRASSGVARVGGKPLVFRGRIDAMPGEIPPGGKSVQLQFRVAGLPWAEFRTVQTDRHGRFRYAYRFNDDDSRGVRFQFRAYAPPQDNWPYEPGGSGPVIVQGR